MDPRPPKQVGRSGTPWPAVNGSWDVLLMIEILHDSHTLSMHISIYIYIHTHYTYVYTYCSTRIPGVLVNEVLQDGCYQQQDLRHGVALDLFWKLPIMSLTLRLHPKTRVVEGNRYQTLGASSG